MQVMIVAWDLSHSAESPESLREYLREHAIAAFSELEGLRLKAWFSDAERQMWGAVYLWDGPEYVDGCFSVSRSIERIGYPPTSVYMFDLEAVTEGKSVNETLSGLGLALNG
ncbi:hypothetical protein J4H86_20955 [Spiractinospora alimapuensis]|uniref:hypothetical protein n=1 Tax=Spiractinospora alimapuensis TaxID=2820884 RepID=UPI001F1F6087|nr:hypothetical protein [Spiractinospora alimapuensis]QVQ51266.1 hypothetical protein J4H86_20955 [Spiractinospora alimapuensis]